MDVLEHIKDDKNALEKIVRALKPNGSLIITVPACMFLWSKFDEMGDYPHVRRYSKKTLLDLLGTQKLNIEKISYYNFFLLPLMFATRRVSKAPKSQLEIPNKLLNRILQTIFSSEKYIASKLNFPIGASLVAICKKK
jgi:SAM-dependent methyltransferase